MATQATLKNNFITATNSRAAEIERITRDILKHPESGYKEVRTSQVVNEWFRAKGLVVKNGIAKTGVVGVLDTGVPGPHVAVIGELDSLVVPDHKHADAKTGAAHACGHHAQIGAMLTVANGLIEDNVKHALVGKISFMAVPAEEYIELEFRELLRESGEIEFFGGKQEFIRLGLFDDVDIAMLTHTGGDSFGTFGIHGSSNGMIGKTIQYRGKASHAGGSPHLGVNALNAALLGLSGIHAQRDTFRDSDTVRVHPIITKGGASVNSVPSDVHLETYVRASNIPAILSTAEKIDRALRAGALATGAQVRIITNPGYLPTKYDRPLTEIYRHNAASLVGDDNVIPRNHGTGCSDIGDVSHIIPTIQPTVNATTGEGHGVDYVVTNYELAVLKSGKAMGMTIIDLLADHGRLGTRVATSFNAPMTINSYLARMRAFRSDITYET